MKYLRRLCVILAFTLAGEALHALLPLPTPAAIYGLALLFAALCCGLAQQPQNAHRKSRGGESCGGWLDACQEG